MGIDPLAGARPEMFSIGAAIENLTTQAVGMSGTLDGRAAMITSAVKRRPRLKQNRIYRADAADPGGYAVWRSGGAKDIFPSMRC